MSLIAATLETELLKLMDKDHGSFVGFGTTAISVATKWADAIDNYANAVVPASTASAAAKAAFISTLTPGVAPGAFLSALISALTAYASALAGGMTAAGFVGTPPPSPIVLTLIPVTSSGPSAATVAATWKAIIDVWFRTGTATPSGGGSPIVWS